MFIANTRLSFAVETATTNSALDRRLSALSTWLMLLDAGFGKDTSAQMDTVGWASDLDLRLLIARFTKNWSGQFQKAWCSTTNAAIALASIQITFAPLRLGRTIIWAKLCAAFLHGAEQPIPRREAYRQPDFFVEPPKPAEQMGLGLGGDE